MEPLCEPCMREGKRENSRFYCTNCEEVYCNTCSKKHATYKISKQHVTKPINAMDITPTYQLYEEMIISTSSISQSSHELYLHPTHSKSEARNRTYLTYPYWYPDVSIEGNVSTRQTTKKSSNKKAKMEDEKTDEHVYQEIEENLEKSYTENAGTEEYPYSYADVSIEGNVSTRQTTNKNSDKKTKMEDEKTDEHVYQEIEENLQQSDTENTENIYNVKLILSPFRFDELNGDFRLRLTIAGVELLHYRTMSRIYLWSLNKIRRHGISLDDHFFGLEAGSGCGRWCGEFMFASESVKEIKEKIDSIIREKEAMH